MDFENTVIIMTSNIGSRFLLDGVQGDSIPDSDRESVMVELRKSSGGRFDETILFMPLTIEEITSIVDLLLADLNKRLAERRVTVAFEKKAHEWVAKKGYDPVPS